MEIEKHLFLCKTIEAHAFKVLIELLHHTVNVACFNIKKNGIYLRQMDANQKILIDVFLDALNFNLYHFQEKDEAESLNIGINLSHLFKMVKSIKKRDSIEIFMTNENPNDLNIKIIPKDLSRITHSTLTIQNIESLEIDLPLKFENNILVNSLEWAKMCKDMLQISPNLKVKAQKYFIKFYSDIQSIFSREVILGNYIKEDDKAPYIYDEVFDCEFISKILKISGLHNHLQLNFETDMPFHLGSKIGSIGQLNMYLKSKKMLESERYLTT
jgi:proliferating cell nuclear antigen PCNA